MKYIVSLLLVFNVFAVDEDQVHSMLNQWQRAGVINQAQLEQAMARLKKVSPKQWKALNRIPAGKSNSPNVANNIEAAKGIDLNSPQFKKIQQQVGNILNK